MYFQVCSNSAYPQHAGERYRTNGPLVFTWFNGLAALLVVIFELRKISNTNSRKLSGLILQK